MKKGKKAQFYIIAAVLIVVIVAGMAAYSNSAYVKQEPKKFYSITEMVQQEGLKQIDYSTYNYLNSKEVISDFLEIVQNYINQNTNENFDLYILYGNISADKINAVRYTRNSGEEVNYYIESTQFSAAGSGLVSTENILKQVNPATSTSGKTVTLTLIGEKVNITQTAPVLQDNNFVYVLTTSDGLNQYVHSNFNP